MRSVVLPEGASPAVQKAFAQVLAVHAALLPNGKILYFGGDQHDPGQHHLGLFDQARLFDCQTFAISAPVPSPAIRDLFCCGHAFLPDGRLLVAGGTEKWMPPTAHDGPHEMGHFGGTREAYVFDHVTGQWIQVAKMVAPPWVSAGGGRWYPTLVTLGSGRVVAVSGSPSQSDTRSFNDTIETFTPAPEPLGRWIDRGTIPAETTLYPRAFLVPDGSLFFATHIAGQSYKWNESSAAWTPVCPGPPGYSSYGYTAALLPLLPEFGYRTRVLAAGLAQAMFIDLNDASPSWQVTGPRTLLVDGAPPNRDHPNAVLLPTGDVVICGGFRTPHSDPAGGVCEIEIYHPVANTWTTRPAACTASVGRNYHSVALLMPDGRVWMAGSNIRGGWSFHDVAAYPHSLPQTAQDGTIDNRDLRIEIYEPWYVGRPDRPVMVAAPASAIVGETITIQTPQAASISRVALVRAGSVTHSFNSDQRYVGIPFTRGAGAVQAALPPNSNLLPPGPYILFLLQPGTDGLQVPSTGHQIRIGLATPLEPPSLTLQLNATQFATGHTMTLTATLVPGIPSTPVDAYIVVRLPTGALLSAQLGGGLIDGVRPLATNFVPMPLQHQVAQYTFTGAEPPGTYTWFAALTMPGTLTFVSALEEDTFTFAP